VVIEINILVVSCGVGDSCFFASEQHRRKCRNQVVTDEIQLIAPSSSCSSYSSPHSSSSSFFFKFQWRDVAYAARMIFSFFFLSSSLSLLPQAKVARIVAVARI
jgi:hypothetical protein